MNRIISLSVEDMYIKYTGEAFGATGSHNAVTLRMTFGPAWEGTAKTAYFTDALGNASVALVLGLDTLVNGAYEVDVPSEALKTAGVATITIKGVLVSGETTTKAITTAAGHFRVLDSELPDSAGNAGTITPSDKDQLQAEIAGMETLFTTAKAAAEAAAANAKVSETNAKASETAASSSASSAEASKTAAAESAATATAQASAADASAAKSAASQKAAQAAETNAKASETAAAASQASAETASASAQASAAAAAKSAQTAQGAASTATNAASSADQSATSASSSASQASAAAAAAAKSAAGVDGINKTAQSWAVGGTGTRPGEDTDNAKYWAKQAEAVVGGDFATKNEAQGYVTAHNQSVDAHRDIRNALNNKETAGAAATAVTAHNEDSTAHADIREALNRKAETFVIQANANVSTSGITISNVDKTLDEVNAAREAGKAIRLKLIMDNEAYQELPLLVFFQVSQKFIYTFSGASTSNAASVQLTFEGDSVRAIVTKKEIFGLSDNAPAAPGTTSAGTSDLAARADHVHPKEVSDTDRATWNGKADLVDGKVPTSQLPEISSVKTYTATIGTTWVEDETTGVKTQSVAIAGVTAQNTALVDHAYTGAGTSDDYAAFVEAENQYLNCITNGYAETYDGGIKFTIFGDANTVEIPIVAEVS
nr:MAG TPA: L SHAPED TAIL FIBER PROTEIN [Caudoviricetes sp.]